MKNKPKKRKWWKILLIVIGAIVLAALSYVAYVFLSYSRIDDMQPLTPEGSAKTAEVSAGTTYTAVTFNIGFGAYTPDFTFFMDGGKQSWANSKESVENCINGAAETALKHDPDFVFYQEVDTDSTRSYHVDEVQMLRDKYDGYTSVFAQNYHSAFLMYPLLQPHGASNSGILMFSNANVNSALRRQLPIAEDFSKIVDLDRCYSVSRLSVDNGKELVLYNIHASAYINDPKILDNQFRMVFEDMEKEYKAGNYVICGGDFNHDFTCGSRHVLNPDNTEEYSWASDFPDEMLPEGINKNTDYSDGKITPTTRNCDVPYGDDCFTVILDGFLTSDNIEVSFLQNMDEGFTYSDHNPVVMKFMLKK